MMNAIAKNLTQQSPAATQGIRTVLLNNSPALVRTMDLNEMRRLSLVGKLFVLVHAPGEGELASLKPAGDDLSPSISVQKAKDSAVDGDILVGDVKLNFSTMEADRKGEPLVLTALEFKTLKYMIQNPRRVISRDELLNEVWGYDNYPTTRTVDNQVSKLRKKLEQDPSRPVHLRTVHGVGYKFLP